MTSRGEKTPIKTSNTFRKSMINPKISDTARGESKRDWNPIQNKKKSFIETCPKTKRDSTPVKNSEPIVLQGGKRKENRTLKQATFGTDKLSPEKSP